MRLVDSKPATAPAPPSISFHGKETRLTTSTRFTTCVFAYLLHIPDGPAAIHNALPCRRSGIVPATSKLSQNSPSSYRSAAIDRAAIDLYSAEQSPGLLARSVERH